MIFPEPVVKNNPDLGRFEIEKDSYLAVLDYLIKLDRIIFTHTGVPSPLEGQGIGSRLARAGLDYARAQGLRVVPMCSFIAGYIQKHPEYQDLVE